MFKKNKSVINQQIVIPNELNHDIVITMDTLKNDELYQKLQKINSSICDAIKEAEKLKNKQEKIAKNISVDNLFSSEIRKMKSEVAKISNKLFPLYKKSIQYHENDVWLSIIKNFTPKD